MNCKQRSIADGWIELESDPGLFTLLIEDFGVKGVEVEEIYDLQSSIEGPVYGFILLFKWLEGGRRKRRNSKFELATGSTVTDENLVNSIFFAHQIVMNSCATHAILSILMNRDDIQLGETLSQLKSFTAGMDSENKGAALNNMPALVRAHNKHVRPSACRDFDDESSSDKGGSSGVVVCSSSSAVGSTSVCGVGSTSQTICSSSNTITKISSSNASKKTNNLISSSSKWQETFHFASFLPVNGHLYEMDSLKPYPIDHGPIPDGMEWHHYFLQLLYDRIVTDNEGESHEIRYNLMALVPRRLDKLQERMALLCSNRTQLILAMKMLIMAIDQDVFRRELHITSFCSRTKLSDAEILSAAECIVRKEENSLEQKRGSVSDPVSRSEDSSEQSTIVVKRAVSCDDLTSIAELECTSNSSYALFNDLLLQCPIESYIVKSMPACHFSIDSKAAGTEKVGDIESENPATASKQDVVELSIPSSLSCLPSTSKFNFPSKPLNVKDGKTFVVQVQFAASSDDCLQQQPLLQQNQFKVECLSLKEVLQSHFQISDHINQVYRAIADQETKKRNYEADDQRRTHDYDEFTRTFFTMLLENELLPENAEKPKSNRKRPTKSRRKSGELTRKRVKNV